MKIKESAEQMAFDLFQHCDEPDGVCGTFDPEAVLNDDAVGRSCLEQFYCVRSMGEKIEVV